MGRRWGRVRPRGARGRRRPWRVVRVVWRRRKRRSNGRRNCDRRGSRRRCRVLPVPQLRVPRVLRLGRYRHRGVLRVSPIRRLRCQLPLRSEALQVAHQPQPQRVLDVQSFAADQIPRNFSRTLPEPNIVVVHRVPLRVVRERVESCNKKHSYVNKLTWSRCLDETRNKTRVHS